MLEPGTLLLLRHAKATGQGAAATLTTEGQEQAVKLAERLEHAGITRIVSSPWSRAIETASPLAARLGLPIDTNERLTERVLSGRNLPHWRTALKFSFAIPILKFAGGESGIAARQRILAVLNETADPKGVTAIMTHGNLMALALGLNFDGWAALKNPDVWVYLPNCASRRYPEA